MARKRNAPPEPERPDPNGPALKLDIESCESYDTKQLSELLGELAIGERELTIFGSGDIEEKRFVFTRRIDDQPVNPHDVYLNMLLGSSSLTPDTEAHHYPTYEAYEAAYGPDAHRTA